MKVRLGDLLVDMGAITREQLGQALRQQQTAGGRLGVNLVELGYIDEKQLASALAKQFSLPSVTQAQLDNLPPEVLRLVPGPLAGRLMVIPLRVDAGRLWLAMANPNDKDAADEIYRLTKRPVRPLVAPHHLIQIALEKYYRVPLRPRGTKASPSFDIDFNEPLGMMPRAVAPAHLEDEVLHLDDADVATGFLDDEPMPLVAGRREELPMSELLAQLVTAGSDEVVIDVALRYLAPRATRLLALLLVNSELSGWRGLHVDAAALARTRASVNDLPLIERALASGTAWVGRLQPMALGPLAAPLHLVRETSALVIPVRIGKRPVGVIIGTDVSADSAQHKPELDRLATKIDHALHINHLKRQLLTP